VASSHALPLPMPPKTAPPQLPLLFLLLRIP